MGGGGTITDPNVFPYELRLRNFNNFIQELMHNTDYLGGIGTDLNKNLNTDQYNKYDNVNKTLYDKAYGGENITSKEVSDAAPLCDCTIADDLLDAIGYTQRTEDNRPTVLQRDKFNYIVADITWNPDVITIPLSFTLIPEYTC